ncbi:uncharacterized protein RJT20DRAFT_63606 [Scheffersomyces xylosifermentans]|uniref:uncharacterized protein n=1 Tax=Scheffersomyces xylosifermentans TaxID=1304137 RepID=UPI00315DFA50
MELLQGYSSDSSSDEEDIEIVDDQRQSQLSKSNNTDLLPVPELVIYSQNYSDTRMNKKSVFLYIPWRPTRDAVSQMNLACSKVLSIQQDLVGLYQWTPTNKQRSPLGYHITTYPNVFAEEYKIKSLRENIRHALKTDVQYPKSAIGYDEEKIERSNRLSKLLGKPQEQEDKCINLKFKPSLKVFASPTSSKLFLSGLIEYSPDVKEFLESLNRVFERSLESLLLEKSPFYNLEHHHITFSVGSPNSAGYRYKDIDRLNAELSQIDVSEMIGDINVGINEIIMTSLGETQAVETFQFNI